LADALVVASAELAAASELEVDVVLAEEAILGAAEEEGAIETAGLELAISAADAGSEVDAMSAELMIDGEADADAATLEAAGADSAGRPANKSVWAPFMNPISWLSRSQRCRPRPVIMSDLQ
jgi:hypothetical protein